MTSFLYFSLKKRKATTIMKHEIYRFSALTISNKSYCENYYHEDKLPTLRSDPTAQKSLNCHLLTSSFLDRSNALRSMEAVISGKAL